VNAAAAQANQNALQTSSLAFLYFLIFVLLSADVPKTFLVFAQVDWRFHALSTVPKHGFINMTTDSGVIRGHTMQGGDVLVYFFAAEFTKKRLDKLSLGRRRGWQ